jgi:hypothetical protein
MNELLALHPNCYGTRKLSSNNSKYVLSSGIEQADKQQLN